MSDLHDWSDAKYDARSRARSAGFVQSLIRDDEFPDWASVEEHPVLS